MHELIRSLSVLGVGFTGVMVVTLGFATLLEPGPAGSAQGGGAAASEAGATPAAPVDGPITDIGGTLTVTGDREGLLVLDREVTELGYALSGPEGRVFFGGDPLEVERISYAGLQVYVDSGECTLTPGERHDPTGVAAAELRCDEVNDIHGDGTVSVSGTVGIAADLLGLRGDLPPSGGTLTVGGDELSFSSAVLYAGSSAFVPGGGFLPTGDGTASLRFDYDVQTHAMSLVALEMAGTISEIPRGGCTLDTRVLGLLNPRSDTAELAIDCPAVELASGETVAIRGTLVVDLVEPG